MRAARDRPGPVLVELVRGGQVESRHRGAVAVADAGGRLVAAWGDAGRLVFPRSAVKPLQALPLIETGAADAFGLGAEELALACGSHSGTARHEGLAARWLARLGLDEAALACGAHPPLDADAAAALLRAGAAPSALHNNCSGKHLGILTAARHRREPVQGYLAPDHPAQRRVTAALATMTGHDPGATGWAVDGCGIPTHAVPLAALATGMARLADARRLPPERRRAVARVTAAMAAHPDLVAGPGRLDTEVMAAAPGVLVKGGAEGVHAAALPGLGLGLALKIEDGAGRAAGVALLAALCRLGALDGGARAALAARIEPPLLNVAGRRVGVLRAGPAW